MKVILTRAVWRGRAIVALALVLTLTGVSSNWVALGNSGASILTKHSVPRLPRQFNNDPGLMPWTRLNSTLMPSWRSKLARSVRHSSAPRCSARVRVCALPCLAINPTHFAVNLSRKGSTREHAEINRLQERPIFDRLRRAGSSELPRPDQVRPISTGMGGSDRRRSMTTPAPTPLWSSLPDLNEQSSTRSLSYQTRTIQQVMGVSRPSA